MNFNLLPYQLNTDISDFKDNMEYISSDQGVDLYRAKDGFLEHILDFPVAKANLYFFEGNLITVYIQLRNTVEYLSIVREVLENAIVKKAKLLETDSGYIYFWQCNIEFLGLLIQEDTNTLLLYHSLRKFNVFNL